MAQVMLDTLPLVVSRAKPNKVAQSNLTQTVACSSVLAT